MTNVSLCCGMLGLVLPRVNVPRSMLRSLNASAALLALLSASPGHTCAIREAQTQFGVATITRKIRHV